MYHTFANCMEWNTQDQTNLLVQALKNNVPVHFPNPTFDASYFIDLSTLKSNADLEFTEKELEHQPMADKYTEKFIGTYISITQA